MTKRLLAVVVLAGGAGVLALAQQPASPVDTLRKERLIDVGTPGVLLPLRTTPVERPVLDGAIDPSTVPIVPDLWETDPATGARYRRGQLLVRFRNTASSSARVLALQRSRATRVATLSLPNNWELVSGSEGTSLTDTADALLRSGAAEQVSLNYEVRKAQVRPNDEGFRFQWNFDAINMPLAWQINPGGRNDVIVAVIDTGLNTVSGTFSFRNPSGGGSLPIRFSTVPDLVAEGRIVSPFDFVYNDGNPLDLDGHGTHVAGTIAQQTNNNIGAAGVAYNVKLMPLKVLVASWDLAFGEPLAGGTIASVAAAIRHAADNNAKIINLSLGGPGPSTAVRDALRYAVDKGVFVAIAAGNDAEEGNPTEYPAAYAAEIAGVMAVGAVNRSLKRAVYSGFQSYVEICAPGGEAVVPQDFERSITQVSYDEESTLSYLDPFTARFFLTLGFRPTFDRFELLAIDGTSMASPHVAGVAALLYSQGIRNPAAIEQAIKKFATPLGLRADECGPGLVDARKALRGLGLGR
jgi:serine protease